MDTTVTETLRHSLTVSDPDIQLTLVSGPTGATGPTGPNAITSSTSSDGTADIQANTLTTGTVSATGNISTSTGNISITSGNIVVTSGGISTGSGSISTGSGDITTSVGDVSVGTGNVSVTNGDVTAPDILASEDLGYSSGGVVTQLTNVTTAVTLNAPSGVINSYVPLTLSAESSSTFTLSNTSIGVNDVVVVSLQQSNSSTGVLSIAVTDTAEGSCDITIFNHSSGSEATAPVINFAVIKVATS